MTASKSDGSLRLELNLFGSEPLDLEWAESSAALLERLDKVSKIPPGTPLPPGEIHLWQAIARLRPVMFGADAEPKLSMMEKELLKAGPPGRRDEGSQNLPGRLTFTSTAGGEFLPPHPNNAEYNAARARQYRLDLQNRACDKWLEKEELVIELDDGREVVSEAVLSEKINAKFPNASTSPVKPATDDPAIGEDGTERRPTMTVREVLTWLSPEPKPSVAGLPPRSSPFYGKSAVWPLVLGLEHMDALDKGNAAVAARLVRDIEAQGVRFGDVPTEAKALLAAAGRSIAVLIEEGRDLCARERKANEAWERFRTILRDALSADRLRASGRACDETGKPTQDAHVEIGPLTWRGPLMPDDDGRIVHDGTERSRGTWPREANSRFTELRFATKDIIAWGTTVKGTTTKITTTDLPRSLTPMQAVAWLATHDSAVVLRASLDATVATRAADALGDTSDWCDDNPGLGFTSINLRVGRSDAAEAALSELDDMLHRGDVDASAIHEGRRTAMTKDDWTDIKLVEPLPAARQIHCHDVRDGKVVEAKPSTDWTNIMVGTASLLARRPDPAHVYAPSAPIERAEVTSQTLAQSEPARPVPEMKKRKSNGADYREKDAPLVAEMRAMIESGHGASAENAAQAVVARAVGGGTDASKVKRLALHYRQTHPTQS